MNALSVASLTQRGGCGWLCVCVCVRACVYNRNSDILQQFVNKKEFWKYFQKYFFDKSYFCILFLHFDKYFFARSLLKFQFSNPSSQLSFLKSHFSNTITSQLTLLKNIRFSLLNFSIFTSQLTLTFSHLYLLCYWIRFCFR